MGENGATGIRFDIFTRQWNDDKSRWEPAALKAFRDTDGKMRLHGIASSTIKDLHGDTMLLSALEDMERAAPGLTIFGNHSYNVPEDVYGQVESASIKPSGKVDKDGEPIYDLPFAIVMNEENDRALQTFKAVEKGSRLGISIGAMIPEGGYTRDKKTGAYTFSHVDLLEASIVGIPANPRSWVENAVKSFDLVEQKKAAQSATLGSPQLTLDTETGVYKIEGNLADINTGSEIQFGFGKTAEPVIAESNDSPEVAEAATCPDCGHGKADGGGCQNAFHSKDVEPDVTDAKIRVIEIDTGDDSGSSSQGASSSDPAPEGEGPAGDDDAADGSMMESADEIIETAKSAMASLDPEVTTMVQRLLDLSNGIARELSAALVREQEALAAQASAEQQRDAIVAQSSALITGMSQILEKLADMPVGRRTVFREVEDKFADLEGVYSRDFLTLLRRT